MSFEQWGIVIGVIGLILAVYFGVKGTKARRSHNQSQKVSNGSAIQSGRDTKVDRRD